MSTEFDDKELFEGAMAEETVAAPAEPEQPQAAVTDEGQSRDERGRFAAAEEPEAQAEQPQPEAQTEEGDKPVPGKRFGEVTRARDEAVRRAEEAERRAQDLEARYRALETQRQPQPTQPLQSQSEADAVAEALLADPATFLAQRDAQNQQQIGVMLNDMQPGGREARGAAFNALTQLQNSNPAAYQAAAATIFSSPPLMQAQSLVEWHKQYQTQQRVGSDPDAFFARTLEERLTSDPAFAASLVEKLTGQARQAQTTPGAKPLLNLPPSLSRSQSAAPAVESGGSMTDAEIFSNALR